MPRRRPNPPRKTAPKSRPEAAADSLPMMRLFTILRNSSGIDFSHYKQPTIRRRLQRRMSLQKIVDVPQYVEFLQKNPIEAKALSSDLLIHVTHFFREPESFEALAEKVFPRLTENREADLPIRVWVPGCSTGEEAYSVAIALLEHLDKNSLAFPLQIFATDVSDSAVERARAGVYSDAIASDVSADRLRRFFNKTDGQFRIAKSVRDVCIFARQDLARDPPFSKLDLILCRNVLIYLGPVIQKRLMNIFHYALKPTGFLMLGGAETVGPHVDLFAIVDKRHKLYTKKIGPGSRNDMEFPSVDHHVVRAEAHRRIASESKPSNTVQNEANRIIVARYSPPGVIVDNDLKIVQFRGQTGPFLEPAPGEASLNLLKMARDGLLYGLRTAIHEARKTERETRKEGLRVTSDTGVIETNLTVFPLGASSVEGRHFLVLFEPVTTQADGKKVPARRPVRATRDDKRIARLEEELAASREYLQSIIQDVEAANEELDTAKEELQSTNEELNTLNEELQGRNEELTRVNSDLVNLLASVHIAIVMVAADLRIRRFTPIAERVLNLIPTDIGRPISDIKPNIDCPDLEQLIIECIDTITIKQRNVQDRDGNWYSLRIRPYKNVENRIDGAVLALFDDTARRAAPGNDGEREHP